MTSVSARVSLGTKRRATLLILGDGRRNQPTLSSESTEVARSSLWWLECGPPAYSILDPLRDSPFLVMH